MTYKQYHTALAMAVVLVKLLKGTELEEKALTLYGDIIELERIPAHQVKTAQTLGGQIASAFESDKLSPPSPFTFWQRLARRWGK